MFCLSGFVESPWPPLQSGNSCRTLACRGLVGLCSRVALRHPPLQRGAGGIRRLSFPNQRNTSCPSLGSNCSMIPRTTLSGSLRTSLSETLIILSPMACICLSLSASRFCASAEKCDAPSISITNLSSWQKKSAMKFKMGFCRRKRYPVFFPFRHFQSNASDNCP